MTGALTSDPPARVVRFENQDGSGGREVGGRDARAGPKRKKTEREERTERWLRNAYWFIFCCGLCEEWDLAAGSQGRGVQSGVGGGG